MPNKNKAVVTRTNNTATVTTKTTTAETTTNTVSNATSVKDSNKAIVSVVNPEVTISGVGGITRVTVDGSSAYTGGTDIEVTDDNVINYIGDSGPNSGLNQSEVDARVVAGITNKQDILTVEEKLSYTEGLNQSEVDNRVSVGITNAPANPDTTLKYNILKTGGFLFEEGDVTGTRTAYTGTLAAVDGIKTYYFDDNDDSWYDDAIAGNRLVGF